ncbi:MAG: hypothetical protein AAF843_08755 [Bacteroidota bacterium]
MAKSENLYTDDNPETTIEGLGFKDEETAKKSIKKLMKLMKDGEVTKNYVIQAAVSMEQRSKHHPHRNDDMKKAEKRYRELIDELKN